MNRSYAYAVTLRVNDPRMLIKPRFVVYVEAYSPHGANTRACLYLMRGSPTDANLIGVESTQRIPLYVNNYVIQRMSWKWRDIDSTLDPDEGRRLLLEYKKTSSRAVRGITRKIRNPLIGTIKEI